MSDVSDATSPDDLVEVWNRYTRSWTEGFAVDEFVDDAFRLRRLSDGAVLPVPFAADRVRRSGVLAGASPPSWC